MKMPTFRRVVDLSLLTAAGALFIGYALAFIGLVMPIGSPLNFVAYTLFNLHF